MTKYTIIKSPWPRSVAGIKRDGYIVYDGNKEICYVFKMGNDWAAQRKFDIRLHAGKTRSEAIKNIMKKKEY